jgi:hypothetical protein
MAGTVAEGLTNDIENFSLFFVSEHLDGVALKI